MDFMDFSELADELELVNKSSAKRTAISRWYYASYHASYQFLENIGINIPKKKQHKAVMVRLINSGNTELRRAGNKFKELQEYRIRADYHLEDPNIEKKGRIKKSKARSKSIIDYVIKDRTDVELKAIKNNINNYLSTFKT